MFTGIDSLLVQQRRDELAREVRHGRPERKAQRSRWAFWLPREIEAASVPA